MARDIDKPHGIWDLQQGTITDSDTGEVFTLPNWTKHVESVQRGRLRVALEQRDLSSDAQNLPGNKPWFEDDWMGYFPRQPDRRHMYSYDLGFRSPYERPDD